MLSASRPRRPGRTTLILLAIPILPAFLVPMFWPQVWPGLAQAFATDGPIARLLYFLIRGLAEILWIGPACLLVWLLIRDRSILRVVGWRCPACNWKCQGPPPELCASCGRESMPKPPVAADATPDSKEPAEY
jgi:hypothetical protein